MNKQYTYLMVPVKMYGRIAMVFSGGARNIKELAPPAMNIKMM